MFEREAEEYWQEQLKLRDQGVFIAKHIKDAFKEFAKFGYAKASEWHYVKDKLPPEPEVKDGEMFPKTYICAYRLNNTYNDFETGDFMYLGNGSWNGENKEYPVYAWLDSPVEVPEPPKEVE